MKRRLITVVYILAELLQLKKNNESRLSDNASQSHLRVDDCSKINKTHKGSVCECVIAACYTCFVYEKIYRGRGRLFSL